MAEPKSYSFGRVDVWERLDTASYRWAVRVNRVPINFQLLLDTETGAVLMGLLLSRLSEDEFQNVRDQAGAAMQSKSEAA